MINKQPIISHALPTTEGIAVDWIADRIYFVDAELNQIEVSDLNGRNRSIVLSGGIRNPRAIALDPRVG